MQQSGVTRIDPVDPALPMAPGTDEAEDWLNRILAAGRSLEEDLTTRRLEEIAGRLTEIATRLDVQLVTGASQIGNQLAGVVVASSGGRLSLWAQNGAHGTVLVLDGVLASGAQVIRAARRARNAGAPRVVGAAVLADPIGLRTCQEAIGDQVVALEEISSAPA